MPRASCARHRHPQSTRRPISLCLPWTTAEHLELRRRHHNPPDTVPCPREPCRRRPARRIPASVPPESAIVSARQDVPHLASTRDSLAVLSPTSPCSLLPLCLAGDAVSLSTCRTPPGHLATYKRSAPPPPLSTPSNFPPSSEPPRPLYTPHCAAPPANCHLAAREPPQSNPTLPSTPGAPATIVEFAVVDTVALHQRHRSPTSQLAVDPLPPPLQPGLLLDEDDASPPSDPPLIQRSSAPRTDSVSKAH
jgi:hypothetical protein